MQFLLICEPKCCACKPRSSFQFISFLIWFFYKDVYSNVTTAPFCTIGSTLLHCATSCQVTGNLCQMPSLASFECPRNSDFNALKWLHWAPISRWQNLIYFGLMPLKGQLLGTVATFWARLVETTNLGCSRAMLIPGTAHGLKLGMCNLPFPFCPWGLEGSLHWRNADECKAICTFLPALQGSCTSMAGGCFCVHWEFEPDFARTGHKMLFTNFPWCACFFLLFSSMNFTYSVYSYHIIVWPHGYCQ